MNFVSITAILNYDVYLETIAVCGTDGSGCSTTVDKAPVCQYLRDGNLIPGADIYSDFSPQLKEPHTTTTSITQCPKAPYAGCMTAPCQIRDGYAECSCPFLGARSSSPSRSAPSASWVMTSFGRLHTRRASASDSGEARFARARRSAWRLVQSRLLFLHPGTAVREELALTGDVVVVAVEIEVEVGLKAAAVATVAVAELDEDNRIAIVKTLERQSAVVVVEELAQTVVIDRLLVLVVVAIFADDFELAISVVIENGETV